MKETINWGIIGLGKIARHFVNDLKLVSNAKLHAVASRSEAKAKDFATEFGASHAFGSYDDLMSCPDLDVVYIATPHIKHCENTLMCLKNKIPVLCEKPFAMNSSEVKKMIDTARANDTFLMEAIWTRFLPNTMRIVELIESGIIGDLVSLKADFGFKATVNLEGRLYNKALGGGSLLDIGIYPLFLAQLLFGNPQEIKAFAQIGETGVDENCSMLLKFSDTQHAILDSTIVNHTPTVAYIYGTKGRIKIHRRWHEADSFTLFELDKEPKQFSFDHEGAKGYKFEAEHVMKCLQEGKKESNLLPLSFSMDLMNLLDRVREEIGLVY